MRIAYLIDRLNPARGGAETYSYDFTRKLAAEGHEVHVFTRAGGVIPPGVTAHEVKASGITHIWRIRSFARNVDRMLAREKFDVIHGTGWTYSQDVLQPHSGVHEAALFASVLRGKSIVWESIRRAASLKERIYARLERMQYSERPARVFVALSDMVKSDMMNFCNVPAESIEVVYNGVDTERFHSRNRVAHRAEVRKRFGIGDGEVVFLIVAHNFLLKGVPELVRCVTEKDFPACRLVVVGHGNHADTHALAESRFSGRVVFTGSENDTMPFYAAADAYVHPTWYDPCSLVALEALASGLPVVTTVMNGAGELITQGVEGRVIVPGEPGQLRDALTGLFDPAARKMMGDAARTLAEKHTLHHNYLRMMEVYEKVLRLKGNT